EPPSPPISANAITSAEALPPTHTRRTEVERAASSTAAAVASSKSASLAPESSSTYFISADARRKLTGVGTPPSVWRSEEHTSELQSLAYLVCRLLLEKKKQKKQPLTKL